MSTGDQSSRELEWLPLLQTLNINHIVTFVAVAELLSFRAAAAAMHLTQSAVSVHIRHLERDLGTALLHRTTRRVELTPHGEVLYSVSRRLVGDLSTAVAALAQEAALERGLVSIAVVPSVAASVLPRALQTFRERHPGIDVQLRDADSHRAIQSVLRGDADFGMLPEPEESTDAIFTPLLEDEYVVVVPASGHVLSEGDGPVTFQELASHELLLNPRGVAVREQLEDHFRRLTLGSRARQEITSTHALVALIGTGFGVGAVPKLALDGLVLEGCRLRSLSPGLHRRIGLLHAKGRAPSPAASALASFLQTRLTRQRSAH